MPIEFPCAACRTQLRVPDQAAGKKTKCPQCGQFMIAPRPHETQSPPHSDPVLEELSELGQTNQPPPTLPFPSTPEEPMAPASAGSPAANPFRDQPIYSGAPMRVAAVHSRVKGPAIGVIVVSILSLLNVLFVMLIQIADGFSEFDKQGEVVAFVIMFGGSGLWSFMTLLGAVQMMRLRSVVLAWAAMIGGLLPCSFCCLISIPFSIWGIVVLSDPQVMEAFKRNRKA